jgi:hypothetical protein
MMGKKNALTMAMINMCTSSGGPEKKPVIYDFRLMGGKAIVLLFDSIISGHNIST